MQPRFIRIPATDLPPRTFVSLVGLFSHESSHGGFEPHEELHDHYHTFMWLLIPTTGKLYEYCVHTSLTFQSSVEICFVCEECPTEQWPDFGIDQKTGLDYRQLNVQQAHFRDIGRRSLNDELCAMAKRCDRIQIFGTVDARGSRLHDIHRNCGEPGGTVRPNRVEQDGAIVFYQDRLPGVPAHRVWALIKFEAQRI